MNKKIRQYIGLAVAVLMYYLIHEGAHLIVALAQGVFKQINFMGMGVQIDVYTEQMNDVQMGIFCLMVHTTFPPQNLYIHPYSSQSPSPSAPLW